MMQQPTASVLLSAHVYTERAKRHKDGSVLLSIRDDRICKLNGVGALIWMILEENPKGLSVDEVLSELREQFEAINSEGKLRYEVSPERLRDDTGHFLKSMTEVNLIKAMTDSQGRDFYCIKEGVSATTSATVATAAAARTVDTAPAETVLLQDSSRPFLADTSLPAQITQASEATVLLSADEDIKPLRRETFAAFIGLLAFDLLLKFRGFESLIKRVEMWPTAEPRTSDREICKRVRAMVDRAQMYYPKKAMCLQHSAVVTYLLRRRGVPAEMILAAQEFPPKGHAWAEVSSEVVNDSPNVKTRYRELRRA